MEDFRFRVLWMVQFCILSWLAQLCLMHSDSVADLDLDKKYATPGRESALSFLQEEHELVGSDSSTMVTTLKHQITKDGASELHTSDEDTLKTLTIPTSNEGTKGNAVPEELCKLTIANHSTSRFLRFILDKDPHFVPIHLSFINTSNLKFDPNLILPLQWVWIKTEGDVDVLQWPIRWRVLTFDLLKTRIPKVIKLDINVTPKDCEIHLGQDSTMHAMEEAIRKFTDLLWNTCKSISLDSTKWCYTAMVQEGAKTSLAYSAAVNIGWYFNAVHYRCCKTDYDWYNSTVTAVCSTKTVKQMYELTTFPAIISILLFIFCPLSLVLIYSSPSRYTMKKYVSNTSVHIRSTIEETDTDSQVSVSEENVFVTGGEYASHVYLNGQSPISVGKVLMQMFRGSICCRFLLARIRRILFLIFFPSLIITTMSLHFNLEHEYTTAALAHGVPLAFLTAFRSDHGVKSFVPYFGGPIGLFVIYFVLGTMLLVLPSDLQKVISTKVVKSDWSQQWSPLWLGFDTIQQLSCMQILDTHMFCCLSVRLLAQFLIVWRPSFWSRVVHIQIDRWNCLFYKCSNSACRVLSVMLFYLTIPIYIGMCLCEHVLCLLYYGCPLVGFIILACSAVFRYVKRKLGLQVLPQDLFFVIFVSAVVSVFFFIFSLMFIHSLAYLTRAMIFTYITVMVSPADAFGYVFFGSALLFYMYKLIRRVGQGYNTLLVHTVAICSRLQSQAYLVTLTEGTLRLTIRDKVERVVVNDSLLEYNRQDTNTVHGISDAGSIRSMLVHDTGLYCGIPRNLFNSTVTKHKPVYFEMFKTTLHLLLIVCLLCLTVELTNGVGAGSELSNVMHVVFIVVMGALPHVLDMPHSESTRRVEEAIWLKEIESTIIEYITDSPWQIEML